MSKLAFIKAVVRNNAVTFIAAACAAVTMFFVPPDGEYLSYFDFYI